MGSNNFLNVKTLISEFKEHSLKDNISEASESGTSNSVTSAEDLQKLVVILGLNSVEDVHQERFRVDRRRLEAMLADNLEESQTAQSFFHRVMTETDTLINWPARLKIGARSKKDPHVRVAGRADDVRRAREKIMQLLDVRSNRVTMKIDVSYTDHSHIIGKGGATIKRVMTDTGCHIHFPDSNRTSAVEKSNQVSIAGDMANVEKARARVRMLTPLVFCFELPIMGSSQPQPDVSAPYVMQVQEQYNVQVMLRNRPKLHANMVVVKGNQWEVDNVTEATTLLMHYMCGNIASQTQVQMSLEISPIHHGIVVGRGADQLKVIMKGTNTQIMFPDADDPNIPVIRKSCVTITGAIKNVYNARQQLVGSLPVVVIFDVPEDRLTADSETVSRLMHHHNVYINIRRKPKQGIASVVIKGIERSAGDIYEARRQLLNGSEPSIAVQIPESYTIPELGPVPFSAFNPFSPSHGHSISSMINSPCSPYVPDLGFGSPMFGQHPPTPGGFPSPLSPGLWVGRAPLYAHSPHYNQHWEPLNNPDMGMPQMMPYGHYQQSPHDNRQPNFNQILNTTPVNQLLNNPVTQLLNMSPRVNQIHPSNPSNPNNPSNASNPSNECNPTQLLDTSNPTSGYQSNFTGSSASLDANNVSGTDTSHVVSPSVSPISKTSPRSNDNDRSQQEIASIIQELPLSERRAPGCEKKTLETMKMSPLSDYRQHQAEANKCMRAAAGGWRVPSSRWAGQLFSRTSPAPLAQHTPEKAWNRSDMGIPSIKLESPGAPATPTATPTVTPTATPTKCRYRPLAELLLDRGLNKYCEIFEKHEVDLWTFASLDGADLTELGITAFGARRRMLTLIADLKKQAGGFKGSPEKKLTKTPPHYNVGAL